MTADVERTVTKPETKEGPLVKQLGNELGRIFRHTLPGIIILLAARLSHPSWFPKSIDYGNSWQLLTLAVVSIAIGNTWYVFHRYSVHQLLDWCFWRSDRKGESGTYVDWLGRHIDESHKFKQNNRDLFEHINFRSAQIIFILITCEVAIFFALTAECDSHFYRLKYCIILGGAMFWLVGAIQQLISYELDLTFAKTYKKESAAGTTDSVTPQ